MWPSSPMTGSITASAAGLATFTAATSLAIGSAWLAAPR